jgi:hypothetical protein
MSTGLKAIWWNSNCGPRFGYNHAISVSDNCNTNNYTNVGSVSVNDTGIDGKPVFTGEQHFAVKEIETFMINL